MALDPASEKVAETRNLFSQSQIGLANMGIFKQLRTCPAQRNPAVFHYIAAIRNFKGIKNILLDQQDRRAPLVDFFNENDGSWNSHIELGLWADLVLIAPLSANTMAKMAYGVADNLLLTTVLSARCPVYFAPAMDLDMYKHPTTQDSIKKLSDIGYHLIEPVEGELASGLKGVGRLEEPENILEVIKKAFTAKGEFSGKTVLVTAGPTFEPIDPVRFIGNHSTGKMGIEIAKSFAERGARVHLVLGPSALSVENQNIEVKKVTTADEMYKSCLTLFSFADIAVLSAAVADFRPSKTSEKKIKKEQSPAELKLEPTRDILAELGKLKKKNQFLVGFALETDEEETNALQKLRNKNLDLIVLNSLNEPGAGFGLTTNKVSLFFKDGNNIELPLKPKTEIAEDIVNQIAALVN